MTTRDAESKNAFAAAQDFFASRPWVGQPFASASPHRFCSISRKRGVDVFPCPKANPSASPPRKATHHQRSFARSNILEAIPSFLPKSLCFAGTFYLLQDLFVGKRERGFEAMFVPNKTKPTTMQKDDAESSFVERAGLRTKPSTIAGAGTGLFATRDFAKEEAIVGVVLPTGLDVHSFLRGVGETIRTARQKAADSPSVLKQAAREGGLPDHWVHALMNDSAVATLFGFCSNDANFEMPSNEESISESGAKLKRCLSRYDGDQPSLNNTEWKEISPEGVDDWKLMILQTTRPILAGEEVFRPYGVCYWFDSLHAVAVRLNREQESGERRKLELLEIYTNAMWVLSASLLIGLIVAVVLKPKNSLGSRS